MAGKLSAKIPYCPYTVASFRNYAPLADLYTKCSYEPMIMQRNYPMPYKYAKHDNDVDGWVWKCIKCSNVWNIDHPAIVWFCHEETPKKEARDVGLGEAQGSNALGSDCANQQQQMDSGRMASDVCGSDFSTSG